jgi:Protein-L-isoaspartate(D-aspartate) O-methyltransferase (PCMT)
MYFHREIAMAISPFLAAAFIFAQQGPQLPPPSFINMPPSPTTTVLLGQRFGAARESSHRLQNALAQKLQREGVIQHDKVFQVMQQVDRANYVDGGRGANSYPYDDSPQSISCGQTISAPHMHGYALEYILDALERPPREEDGSGGAGAVASSSTTNEQQQQETFTKVLDVGCGSGYLTAALGRWVHPHDGTSESRILSKPGKVYGYVHWMRW